MTVRTSTGDEILVKLAAGSRGFSAIPGPMPKPALGVLVDNALEATKNSAAPLVTLELHNAENDMEAVVRNTCQDIENVFAQSTKPGHEGLGITSLRGILSKHTNALFNLFTQGRFVEAHLLMR